MYLIGAGLQGVQHKPVDLRIRLGHSNPTWLYQEVKVRPQVTHQLGQAAPLGAVIQPVVGEDAGCKPWARSHQWTDQLQNFAPRSSAWSQVGFYSLTSTSGCWERIIFTLKHLLTQGHESEPTMYIKGLQKPRWRCCICLRTALPMHLPARVTENSALLHFKTPALAFRDCIPISKREKCGTEIAVPRGFLSLTRGSKNPEILETRHSWVDGVMLST